MKHALGSVNKVHASMGSGAERIGGRGLDCGPAIATTKTQPPTTLRVPHSVFLPTNRVSSFDSRTHTSFASMYLAVL